MFSRVAAAVRGPIAAPISTALRPSVGAIIPNATACSPFSVHGGLFTSTSRRFLYVERLKKYNPTTAGFRHRRIVDHGHLYKGGPVKSLTYGLRERGGRNDSGQTTVWCRGGGHRKRYRLVDFARSGTAEVVVERLEYDPNRTAWLALVKDTSKGTLSYILCPKNIQEGDLLRSGDYVDIQNGNHLQLKNIPVGTLIHNIEIRPGQGGQIARSAGAYAQILKTGAEGYALLRLMSGEQRLISVRCRATIGVVSNTLHKNEILGKAGANRWRGFRSSIRGCATNPVDHPHGGRTKGGRPDVTPWAKITKGQPTRNNKRTDRYIVFERRRAAGKFTS